MCQAGLLGCTFAFNHSLFVLCQREVCRCGLLKIKSALQKQAQVATIYKHRMQEGSRAAFYVVEKHCIDAGFHF